MKWCLECIVRSPGGLGLGTCPMALVSSHGLYYHLVKMDGWWPHAQHRVGVRAVLSLFLLIYAYLDISSQCSRISFFLSSPSWILISWLFTDKEPQGSTAKLLEDVGAEIYDLNWGDSWLKVHVLCVRSWWSQYAVGDSACVSIHAHLGIAHLHVSEELLLNWGWGAHRPHVKEELQMLNMLWEHRKYHA